MAWAWQDGQDQEEDDEAVSDGDKSNRLVLETLQLSDTNSYTCTVKFNENRDESVEDSIAIFVAGKFTVFSQAHS